MVDRFWHKTLLRCRPEKTGINRNQTKGEHYRETTTSVISYKELSPRFLPQSGRMNFIFPEPFKTNSFLKHTQVHYMFSAKQQLLQRECKRASTTENLVKVMNKSKKLRLRKFLSIPDFSSNRALFSTKRAQNNLK